MDDTAGKDRTVDGALVLLAAAGAWWAVRSRGEFLPAPPTWLLHLDLVAGALGCLALAGRRRRPLVVATLLIGLSTFAESPWVAVLIAVFTVASRCPARVTAVVFAGGVLAQGLLQLLRPEPSLPWWGVLAFFVAVHVAVVTAGLLVRNRGQLVASLRDRAAAAEVEARLRAERSQHEARETLAREMHDVLGHRLSLLSVHAGAMTYHRDATPEEMRRAAEVVRENAHRALQDLREVIGVLRAPVGELPTPGVADVPGLVEEAVRAGTPVDLHDDAGVIGSDGVVGSAVGRTLYRLVQEGLTNVRVHAAGAPVVVRITGRLGDHLAVEVVNDRPAGSPGRPGSGNGLRGLAERAALIGGSLEHGPTGAGGWRVGMSLPWPR